MAMVDYGAIGFKNGKLISTEMFTPMIDTVNWVDDAELDKYYTFEGNHQNAEKPLDISDNYFLCVGDRDHTICFYKDWMNIFIRDTDCPHRYWRESELFSTLSYKCNWTKWNEYIGDGMATVKKRNGYYVFKWKYKGDKYKVYFGYGVDLEYYKKTHRVNYYRSLDFLFSKFKRWVKDWLELKS